MKHPRVSSATISLLAFVLLALAAPLHAQEILEGKPIRRIEIDAPASVDAGHVREAIHTREGDLYSRTAIQADIASLYALGEFSSVRIEPKAVNNELDLTIRLIARPRVKDVRYEGEVNERESSLTDLLQAKGGAVASPYNLKVDLRILQDHYHDIGYLFAEISQELIEEEGGTVVIYHIQSGPKVKLESIQFEGVGAIPADELRTHMLYSRESGFSTGRFDWQFLRSDLLSVREAIRRKGYLDATVGHRILFDDGKERAHLLVDVELGPLYSVSRLVTRGASVIGAQELRNAIVTGEGSAYSQEQLEKDINTIRGMYGRLGYIKAKVDIDRTFAEDRPEVALVLNVNEGPKMYVNRVLIQGNAVTEDHVIRREVSLIPGSIFNTQEMDESKRRLMNTGLFFSKQALPTEEPVQIRWVDTDEPDKADAIVEVKEGSVGSFSVGAMFSSELGLAGNLTLTYSNFDALNVPRSWRQLFSGDAFVGGGQKLTLSLTPGTIYRDYRLSWLNPSVWDSPYSTGFDLYLHDFFWDGYYDDTRAGGSVTVGRTFFKDLHVGLTPRVESIDIHNIDDDAPEDARDAKGSHTRDSIALSASYDKRDNIFLTSSGYNVGATVEMAGTGLGGDVDWLRETLEGRKWWTVWNQENWGKHTVNVGGEVATMQSTKGEIPIFDRLFAGGLGSIRGFQFRGIGPVDDEHHKQVGGKYRLLMNGEYEAPLVRDMLRGVLFMDAGSLGDSASDLGDVRASIGTGLRIRIPAFGAQRIPISLYVATPLNKKDHDKTEFFSFTIGTGFEF